MYHRCQLGEAMSRMELVGLKKVALRFDLSDF